MFICFFILSLKLLLILGEEEEPIVTIPNGKLKGSVSQTVGQNITYYSFRGIPFAKKPVGDLRFANPVKNDPWTGTLDASQDKDSCTQAATPGAAGQGAGIQGSEDCLYINVYTTNINGSLPVMVWIYGGGFTGGTSSYIPYAPDYIIEKNVVYVAFNYRLGVFGFLSTEDFECPGNWGLKDQVLALKWVQSNIQFFGGDSNKVTIFGQSAGSASVSYLVQSSLTTGLFQRAIMQSGTSLCLWALTLNARRKAFTVGVELGIFTLSSDRLIDQLRKVDYRVLSMAERNVTSAVLVTDNILAGLPFGVVEEQVHPDAVFSSKSHLAIRSGKFGKIDLIIGYTSNEAVALGAYVDAIRPVLLIYGVDKSRVAPNDLTQNFFMKYAAGREIINQYFQFGPIDIQSEEIIKFFTNDQFNRPVRETVRLASAFNKVYYYRFSYEGRLGNPNLTYSGVGHADDLHYLFASPRYASPDDILNRNKFVTLWTNFAKTGNPTPLSNDPILDNIIWEPNKPGDHTAVTIKYLNINKTLSMESNPEQVDWEFYQDIYRKYGDPPYSTY